VLCERVRFVASFEGISNVVVSQGDRRRLCGLALIPALASAHVVADPDEGPAGGSLRTALRITHGCKGSPTTAVTVRLPEGVFSAKPMAKAGWTIEIRTRALETPVDSGHGFKIREAVTEVTWRGGRLDNAQFDEFVLMLRLPDLPPGKAAATLYFPTVQACEKGGNNWTGIRPTARTGTTCPSPPPS